MYVEYAGSSGSEGTDVYGEFHVLCGATERITQRLKSLSVAIGPSQLNHIYYTRHTHNTVQRDNSNEAHYIQITIALYTVALPIVVPSAVTRHQTCSRSNWL